MHPQGAEVFRRSLGRGRLASSLERCLSEQVGNHLLQRIGSVRLSDVIRFVVVSLSGFRDLKSQQAQRGHCDLLGRCALETQPADTLAALAS